MRGDPLNNSRRTHASSVHTVGGSAGGAGNPAANGFNTALTRLDTKPPTYLTTVPGSNAVGHGRKDGTAGNVTAALWTSSTAENVCAAKELTATRADAGDS